MLYLHDKVGNKQAVYYYIILGKICKIYFKNKHIVSRLKPFFKKLPLHFIKDCLMVFFFLLLDF